MDMKTALLHYWLTNLRGGEKVLAALGEMFPEADVFTHAYGEGLRGLKGLRGLRGLEGHVVHESFIARLPFGRKWPQMYLPLMPMANGRFDLGAYDLIVSSESGPIKGIVKRSDQRHVCYCHTPMRYVWDMYDDYYAAAGIGGKIAMKLWTPYMRREDLKSAEAVDQFVANSKFVAERIRRIYGRDSVVVHPPVAVDSFAGEYEKDDYYLLAGQLIDYKRPELAIAACAKMGRKVVVVGNGNKRMQLERVYADNPLVTFLGRVSDEALKQVYGRARALLFPGLEDFGIVPVEAQAAGTPVIAFGMGGALETVRDGETGLLFSEQTVEALCGTIEEFESRKWSAAACRVHAGGFSKERFVAEMRQVLEK